MAFIVFDMEWNQPMSASMPQRGAHGVKLTGEIFQIGAVKLSDGGVITDTFSMLIRPKFYTRLNKRVRDLCGITKAELADAEDFPTVCGKFLEFCGTSPVFLTWGPDDIPMLKQNMQAFGIDSSVCSVSYNLQPMFNLQTDGAKGQRSLDFALAHFQIEKNLDAHNAYNDAYHTALVAMRLDLAGGIASYSSISSLWERPLFSEELGTFNTKKAAFTNDSVACMPCPVCKARLETAKWAAKGGGHYVSIASCKDHGRFIGRMKFAHGKNETLIVTRSIFKADKAAEEYYADTLKKSETRKAAFKAKLKEKKKHPADINE